MKETNAEPTSAPSEVDELRKRKEKLLALVNELSTQFAAVHFKAYEMAEEIRNLEMRLSGTEASCRCIEWENSQLRREIRFLRKVLLEIVDPPPEIRALVAAYRREMERREPTPDDAGK